MKKSPPKFQNCPQGIDKDPFGWLDLFVREHAWIYLSQSRVIAELVEQGELSGEGLEDYLEIAEWDSERNAFGQRDKDWNYLMELANEVEKHGFVVLPGGD